MNFLRKLAIVIAVLAASLTANADPIYVGQGGGTSIYRYDLTTGSFVDEFINHFGTVGDLSATDGTLYVGQGGGTSVFRYDLATGSFIDDFIGHFGTVGGLAINSSTDPEPVTIDIKPGSDPNNIKPAGNKKIPVAILTNGDFSAQLVDPLSVQFGPDGATESHGRAHIEDVDDDGDMDMLLHFNTQETGIVCGDTVATLTGEAFGGEFITGSDSIVTVKCD